MVFSSVIFLFYFLPLFLAVYYAIPAFRNTWLLLGSLVFYAWGELAYLPVLALSLTVNYLAALAVGSGRRRRLALSAGVLGNIVILVTFKYMGFIDATLAPFLGFHIPGAWRFTRIPLGISFYTFQAISYLVDVYRREAPCERNPLRVATFIVLFPQLIAGPIVRFKTVCDELHERRLEAPEIARGIRLFVLGLASKVLLANALAGPADAAFSAGAGLGASMAWLGVLCYALQIYYDFAGYSWMAIGLGLMMGFHFLPNFDLPYVSSSVTEFWRRWHISLSTWFRDYLYIPLGGNRRGVLRTYGNLAFVFLVCGVWHGANWTFVLWGAYYGAFLIIERACRGLGGARLLSALGHAYLILVVLFGWVLFRATSVAHAWEYARAMLGQGGPGNGYPQASEYLSPDMLLVLLIGLLMAGPVPLLRVRAAAWARGSVHPHGRVAVAVHAAGAAAMVVLLIASAGALASGTHNPFIYFNF